VQALDIRYEGEPGGHPPHAGQPDLLLGAYRPRRATGQPRPDTNSVRWPPARVWLPAAMAILCAAGVVVLAQVGAQSRTAKPFAHALDTAAAQLGFTLAQIELSGYANTDVTAILDRLRLGRSRSLIGFDAAAARSHLRELAWVKDVVITRHWPDRLRIAIDERRPFALAAVGGDDPHAVLYDANGVRLARAVPLKHMGLVQVSGDGAGAKAADAVALVAPHPSLADRITRFERVGRRRWTLHIDDGRRLLLPEIAPETALAEFMRLAHDPAILAATEIDLRVPGRMILRPHRRDRQQRLADRRERGAHKR